jgi:hypothetical protein
LPAICFGAVKRKGVVQKLVSKKENRKTKKMIDIFFTYFFSDQEKVKIKIKIIDMTYSADR